MRNHSRHVSLLSHIALKHASLFPISFAMCICVRVFSSLHSDNKSSSDHEDNVNLKHFISVIQIEHSTQTLQ
jgi:hypothetical protein